MSESQHVQGFPRPQASTYYICQNQIIKKKKRCSKGVLLGKSITRYADDCHLLTNIRHMNDISETSRLWNTTKFLFKGIFDTMLLKFLQYTVI